MRFTLVRWAQSLTHGAAVCVFLLLSAGFARAQDSPFTNSYALVVGVDDHASLGMEKLSNLNR